MPKQQDLDDFDRAEGAQEIAFRNWQRAKRHNAGPLIQSALANGKRAYVELKRLSSKLSTPKG